MSSVKLMGKGKRGQGSEKGVRSLFPCIGEKAPDPFFLSLFPFTLDCFPLLFKLFPFIIICFFSRLNGRQYLTLLVFCKLSTAVDKLFSLCADLMHQVGHLCLYQILTLVKTLCPACSQSFDIFPRFPSGLWGVQQCYSRSDYASCQSTY